MRRVWSALVLVSLISSCIGWSTIRDPIEPSLRPEQGPHKIRVLLLDSTSVTLRGALVNSGTISGHHDVLGGADRVIPRDSVRAVQRQKFRVGSLLLGVAVGFALMADGLGGIFDGLLPSSSR